MEILYKINFSNCYLFLEVLLNPFEFKEQFFLFKNLNYLQIDNR